MSLARDLLLSARTAGFVTVLVGFASSAVIVFQAAGAVGATAAQVGSWMLALGLGMGVTCMLLSPRYRVPVAPFGGFTLNWAAITAAICMGREAHEDPRRRYVAAMAAGGLLPGGWWRGS